MSQLFDEHGRMVYGVCRVLLRNADEAEDAAQQVFLSAHRSMLGGTQPREAAAWLGAIARNECRSRIRARMATPLALAGEPAGLGADVEHVAEQRAEVEALCAALAELPEQQRQAIVLREFYGLSYEEVSAALGLTDGAVESLLFRARKRLQDELRPARIASGALALPLAFRDGLAAAVPGFVSASSGGLLAKLAAIPAAAKLAAAAATLTAAGTMGFVVFDGRERGARVDRHPESSAEEVADAGRPKRDSPVQLARAPVAPQKPPSRRHDAREEDEQGEAREDERAEIEEYEVEDADVEEAEIEGGESGESGETDESEEPDEDDGDG